MKALSNKIIIKKIEEEKVESLIATVKIRKDSLLKGEVIDVSFTEDLNIGDIVLFSAYGYEEYNGYIIITSDMLYAKLPS